jgi:hypothetical protein
LTAGTALKSGKSKGSAGEKYPADVKEETA